MDKNLVSNLFSRRRKENRLRQMNQPIALAGLIGATAGLTYLLDPTRGRRRRAGLRDKIVHLLDKTGDAVGATSRDLSHRLAGLWAETGTKLRHEEVGDEVLEARVRARLGRLVTHSRSIEVSAQDGVITLRGPILASDVDRILAGVPKVRGVKSVINQLEVHQDAGDVPGLQGEARHPESQFELMQRNWSPTARLISTASGGALVVYGLRNRGPMGLALGAVGAGLMVRGLTNIPMSRMAGGGDPHVIHVHKTINLAAPVERVFEIWSNFQNFPRFMAHVQEVQPSGNNRSHWVVKGPGGIPVMWDAVTTRMVPNRELAWESVPGSPIMNAGNVQFRATGDNRTQVDVTLYYNPPGGALGHLAAKLFGADPKSEMDQDLLRMKTFIESGVTPHDAANPAGERPSSEAR